jgi:hypothetical protein
MSRSEVSAGEQVDHSLEVLSRSLEAFKDARRTLTEATISAFALSSHVTRTTEDIRFVNDGVIDEETIQLSGQAHELGEQSRLAWLALHEPAVAIEETVRPVY